MMDVQTAYETWNAANADLKRLHEETLRTEDTADNLGRWLRELNDVRDRLNNSSKVLAEQCRPAERNEFLSIVGRMLANIQTSQDDMRAQISNMN